MYTDGCMLVGFCAVDLSWFPAMSKITFFKNFALRLGNVSEQEKADMLLVHADLLCCPSPLVPADAKIVGLLTACYAALPIARSASTRHATRGPHRQLSWAQASATSAAAAAPSAPTTTTARTALTMRPVGQTTPARSRHAQSLTKAHCFLRSISRVFAPAQTSVRLQ